MLRQPGSRRQRAGRMGCWLCVKVGGLGRDTEEVGPELYPKSALSAGLYGSGQVPIPLWASLSIEMCSWTKRSGDAGCGLLNHLGDVPLGFLGYTTLWA